MYAQYRYRREWDPQWANAVLYMDRNAVCHMCTPRRMCDACYGYYVVPPSWSSVVREPATASQGFGRSLDLDADDDDVPCSRMHQKCQCCGVWPPVEVNAALCGACEQQQYGDL